MSYLAAQCSLENSKPIVPLFPKTHLPEPNITMRTENETDGTSKSRAVCLKNLKTIFCKRFTYVANSCLQVF